MTDKTILVVDDDDMVRETLVEVIQLLFEEKIVEAVNGKEALNYIEQNDEEIILITDVNMPIMNGHELVEQILEQGRQIPILVISGYNENAKKHEDNFGGIEFMGKPVNLEDIQKFLQKALT